MGKTSKITTKQLEDIAWRNHPLTWRNNRGAIKTKTGYITYGIPDPPHGRKPDKLKGGDRIGWTDVIVTPDMVGKTVAVFTSIEIKGSGDQLKPGQIKWHNLVLRNGGISEIWKANGEIIKNEIG